jgi:hypothetical protein
MRRNKEKNKNFWEELRAYFPFVRQGQPRKRKIMRVSHISTRNADIDRQQGDLTNLTDLENYDGQTDTHTDSKPIAQASFYFIYFAK